MSKHELKITKITYGKEPTLIKVKDKKTGVMCDRASYKKVEIKQEITFESFFSIYNLEKRKDQLTFDAGTMVKYQFEQGKAA